MKLQELYVKPIEYEDTKHFILNLHYAKRMPSISWAFGLFKDSRLLGVITFGKSASPALTTGILGEKYSKRVYELNRLVLLGGLPSNSASYFVSRAMKYLVPYNLCIVSFSDLGMKHNGYIYQACNFLFTGTTKSRTDKYVANGKHSRHYDKNAREKYRIIRTEKNRYVYFACDKKHRSIFLSNLKYPILPYPKIKNNNYILGSRPTRLIKIIKTGKIISEKKLLIKKYYI